MTYFRPTNSTSIRSRLIEKYRLACMHVREGTCQIGTDSAFLFSIAASEVEGFSLGMGRSIYNLHCIFLWTFPQGMHGRTAWLPCCVDLQEQRVVNWNVKADGTAVLKVIDQQLIFQGQGSDGLDHICERLWLRRGW